MTQLWCIKIKHQSAINPNIDKSKTQPILISKKQVTETEKSEMKRYWNS